MSDANGLIAGIEAEAGKLRALSGQVAAELKRGPEARIAEIDILRPQILQGLAALNQFLLQCGHIPPGERPPSLFPLTDRMRMEANRWRDCDQIIAQQVPPQPRPLEASRQSTPSVNSSTFTLMDHAVGEGDGLRPSALARALHGAYRVLLGQGHAGEARFGTLGDAILAVDQMAAVLFEKADEVAAANVILVALPEEEEGQALASLAPGTLAVHPDPTFVHRAAELGCGRLATGLYAVGTDRDAADSLVTMAEFTGLGLPPPRAIRSEVWQEIFDVSAARGFYPSSPNVSFVA